MNIKFHSHARLRMLERGAREDEVTAAIIGGEKFPANFNRTGFRRNFPFQKEWKGRYYANKQILAFAVRQVDEWLVISIITKYY